MPVLQLALELAIYSILLANWHSSVVDTIAVIGGGLDLVGSVVLLVAVVFGHGGEERRGKEEGECSKSSCGRYIYFC